MRIGVLLGLSTSFGVVAFVPQRRAFLPSRVILSVIDEAAVAASVSVDQIPKKSMDPIAPTPTQELPSAVPPSVGDISATTPSYPTPEPAQKSTVVVPASTRTVDSPGGDSVDFDLPVPAIAGGLLALFAVGTFAMRQRVDEDDEPAPLVDSAATAVDDVSIPYDAAARLAYDTWRADHNKGAFDSTKFAAFKVNYEKVTVANIVAKKKARETKSKPKLLTLSSSADQ